MNKYIESDIRSGVLYLKCAIMNIIHGLLIGVQSDYYIGDYIPFNLFVDCLEELGFDIKDGFDEEYEIPKRKGEYIVWEEDKISIRKNE